MIRLIFNPVFGMMVIPPCPHEDCGWFMPDLTCPDHGNFGMTYLSVQRGPVTWVKPVLDIPQKSLPAELDILELGARTASWLAAAADDPQFMLARHILHSRPPQRKTWPRQPGPASGIHGPR